MGDTVNGMKKGKASLHKAAVFNCFEVHGGISANGVEEANIETIAKQIAQLTNTSIAEISFA